MRHETCLTPEKTWTQNHGLTVLLGDPALVVISSVLFFWFRRHPEKTQGMRLGPKLTWKKSKKRGNCQVDHKATRQPSCPKIMNDHTLQQTKPVMTFWAGKLMKIIYQEGVFQSLPRRVEASKGKMIITIQPIQSIHIPHMLLGWTRNLQLRVRHVTTANFGQGI